MPRFARVCCTLLLGLLVLPALAQTPALPDPAQVQASLDGLADRNLAEPDRQALRQTLEQTLEQLQRRDEAEADLKSLQEQLAGAPQAIAQAQKELQQLIQSGGEPSLPAADTPLDELEARLAKRSEELSAAQKALSEASNLVVASQTRPERAQTELASNQARAAQIDALLKSGREAGKALSDERRDQLRAERAALEARNALRRQELAGNSLLLELGNANRELQEARSTRLDKETQGLQELLNRRRLNLSETTYQQLAQEAQASGGSGLLSQESAINLEFSNYLLKTTDRLNLVSQRNLRTKQQLDALQQSSQALEEQIDVLRGSPLLANILFEQRRSLRRVATEAIPADEIADIRLYQFELNKRREAFGSASAYVQKVIDTQNEAVDEKTRSALLELAQTRAQLFERLGGELNALLNESISLQLNQQQLQSTSEQLRTTLDEQLFWIPSNRPLNLEWLRTAPGRLAEQVSTLPWREVAQELFAGLFGRPWVFLPLLLIGVLLWRRVSILAKLTQISHDISHYQRDSQWHTPVALLLNLLLAVPGSLLLALCGYALLSDARGQNAFLGAALLEMAKAWLVLYATYRVLARQGVAQTHFGWAGAQVVFLHRQVRWLGLVVVALVGVFSFAEYQPASLSEDVLGILVVMLGYAVMSALLFKLLLRGPSSENAPFSRMLIGVLFALLPLALMIAVGFGYYYTALKLSDRLVDTLYVLIFWVVIEATLVRGLAVAARRLAYQRAIARRETEKAETPDGVEIVEEPTLDLEQVNQQSLRLIRLALYGLLAAALYWVWADVITVSNYLGNVVLYTYGSSDGSQSAITLLDLFAAAFMVGITLMLTRNLPGLLEVLVLSRMQLAQGSAYATTTLLSYVLFGIGFVATLSSLGVSWDKLQWLVAALSVGLGFGMQEIFANFISGLIILFERPVRIGDLVTVGGVTGTVNRIRIRATHIIDPDKKMVIVPNKTFVTSQLINWTLTDTITRLVLKVGVGYGSDLTRVRELLYQAARENARVMADPEPLVLFQVFGESTLDHDLIIHVRELGDRGRATDEVNRRIFELFNENGIEIAFRQVDVFVKNLDNGQEQPLQQGILLGAAGAAADASKPVPPPAV